MTSSPALATYPGVEVWVQKGEILRFQLSPSNALLVLFDGKHGAAWEILGQNSEFVKADTEKLIVDFAKRFRETSGPTASIRAKILGAPNQIDRIKMSLGSIAVTAHSSAHCSSISRTEVFFYSDTGRLRVSDSPATELNITSSASMPAPEPILVSATSSLPLAKRAAKTKVLIVDDSKTIRDLLSRIISTATDLEIVGAIERPSLVQEAIDRLKPDVMTLDINMPEMDGVTLLGLVMARSPLPVVMISSVSLEEGSQVMRALELGAVDYIQKPSFAELNATAPIIIEKIRMASQVNVRAHHKKESRSSSLVRTNSSHARQLDNSILLAIGASTGGTEAIRQVLLQLPSEIPPTVIVQHIPPIFSKAFAQRLNELCPFEVKEAEDGDLALPNRVLIAPGGFQMRVRKGGDKLLVKVTEEAPVNRHRPSVDVLFDSVAKLMGPKAVGAILTGMGADGAQGLLHMKQAGAKTLAQDEKSCVVFGMPREAIARGAADEVVPLDAIGSYLIEWLEKKKSAA